MVRGYFLHHGCFTGYLILFVSLIASLVPGDQNINLPVGQVLIQGIMVTMEITAAMTVTVGHHAWCVIRPSAPATKPMSATSPSSPKACPIGLPTPISTEKIQGASENPTLLICGVQ